MSMRNTKIVMNQYVQSQRCASSKAQNKVSMKQQMEVPTAEELVRINEGMRKSMHEGKKIKLTGSTKRPSAVRIFGLALIGGIALGLFQQYSFSGQGPPRANPIEQAGSTKIKEEITIVQRRTGSNS